MRRLSVGLCSSADGSRASPAVRMLDYTVKKAALFPGSGSDRDRAPPTSSGRIACRTAEPRLT
jgi:hypothetical protein